MAQLDPATADHDFRQLIDGRLETSPQAFDVINPATGEPFAQAPSASPEQLDAAVKAARIALPAWSALSEEARRSYLHAFADGMDEEAAALAEILTREQGKPLMSARFEIAGSAASIRVIAAIEIKPQVLFEQGKMRRELHYRPLGVVAAITPWNAPILLAIGKIAEGLQTGNTMVLKPSPYTPLTTLKLGEIAARTLPPGVLNILAGGNELGAQMTEHPGVDMITFTGSSATGKRIAAVAATNGLKRVLLELGGNDPAIVLEDADIAMAAPKIFRAAFTNAGQICMAVKRLYVHESLYPAMRDALSELARATKVGDGFEPGVTMGPLQNKAQYDRVLELIEDARAQGAEFAAGGHAMNVPGYFIPPTIVTGLTDGTRLVDEEQFGPVLPIIPFTDLEATLARANATRYGLSGSIWTRDEARGYALARRLEVGTAWVNKHLEPSLDAPFGGAKESGIGRNMTDLGAKGYMEPQVVDMAF